MDGTILVGFYGLGSPVNDVERGANTLEKEGFESITAPTVTGSNPRDGQTSGPEVARCR